MLLYFLAPDYISITAPSLTFPLTPPVCIINASTVFLAMLSSFWFSVPWPGIEPWPWQWKSGILTTRLPGSSLLTIFKLLEFSELSVSSFLAYVLCVSFLLSHHVFSFAFSARQIPSHSPRHNSNIIHEKLFRTLSYTSSLTCCLFSGLLKHFMLHLTHRMVCLHVSFPTWDEFPVGRDCKDVFVCLFFCHYFNTSSTMPTIW